jgi:5-methylcytosine-specific restriction endonuclease McrA
MTINELLRQRVRKRADGRCEYCHSPEKISSTRFTIDHVQPRSLGGSDEFENLALACSRCNQHRYNFISGRDLETATITPLFNPRVDSWAEHFVWSKDGKRIVGITPVGRATCNRLDLNDDRYQGEHSIVDTRSLWAKAGWHPPTHDPVE